MVQKANPNQQFLLKPNPNCKLILFVGVLVFLVLVHVHAFHDWYDLQITCRIPISYYKT